MSGKTIWKGEFVFIAYDLARAGMVETKMAKVLGVSVDTFRRWESKKKLFGIAVKRGRKLFRKKDGTTFSYKDFVVGRLSDDAKEVWDKISRCDRVKNGVERIEVILSERGVRMRQQLFVKAWFSSNFSFSSALRKVNISRSTFELWKKDPEFLGLVEEMGQIQGDFFEEHLVMLVAGGDTSATLMANQTYNKKRGYGAKVEVEVFGNIQHNVIQIDTLGFTLKERKWLLKKVRDSNIETQLPVKQIESKVV